MYLDMYFMKSLNISVIQGQQPIICQFEPPITDKTHMKAEVSTDAVCTKKKPKKNQKNLLVNKLSTCFRVQLSLAVNYH